MTNRSTISADSTGVTAALPPDFTVNPADTANAHCPAPNHAPFAPQPTALFTKLNRISALDFTKGALVLIMVLYHWLNYFVGPEGSYYRYLRFLTPSFIFITGFFISHVYLRKYDVRDPRLPLRLLHRGLKLLGVFVFLNVATSLFVSRSMTGTLGLLSPDALLSVYFTGNTARVAAFSILVPISYLLLLGSGFAFISRFYRNVFHAAAICVLLCALILAAVGIKNAYLELVSIGLIGVSCGYASPSRLNKFLDHTSLFLLSYLLYVCAITLWREVFALQIVGVCLSLALLYLLGRGTEGRGGFRAIIVLLGKYSLLGYIAQIFILQALRRGLAQVNSELFVMCVSFVAGSVLTVLCVYIIDQARGRLAFVNRMYAAVFL